ncbi:MAG: PatB family C-S lyase [Rhodobacteraceae bacterium]|nr:PatB family C-S lyase [Paracoccaceae bacterium]
MRSRRHAKWTMFGAEAIPAWVAEMDFALALPIRRAIAELSDRMDFGYPLREGGVAENAVGTAFARRMKSRFGWEIDPQLVQPVAELVQGTFAPIMAFSDPGDGIVLHTPAYPPFYEAISTLGRTLVANRLRDGARRFEIDFDALEAAIGPRTRMILLCNPQNPTGRVFEPAELARIAAIALARDLVVVSDEIHSDLVFPGHRHIPFATLSPEIAARTVTISSATKSFNIPGLRCAVMHFGTQALRDRFHERIPRRLLGAPAIVGIDATIAAWDEGQPWLDEVMDHLAANRDHLVLRVARDLPGVSFHPPEATYMAWLDCSGLKLDRPAQRFFLEEAKVAMSAGETFDPAAPHFLRLNFATSRSILDEIIDRMAAAVRRRGRMGAAAS